MWQRETLNSHSRIDVCLQVLGRPVCTIWRIPQSTVPQKATRPHISD